MYEYSAERHVFEIPELRRHILSFIIEDEEYIMPRNRTCVDDLTVNCCCFFYLCCGCKCFVVYDILSSLVTGHRR